MEANEIINKLRQAMKAAGITQADAARRLNCSQTQISQYFRGAPRLDNFLKLCDAAGIDPADLMKEEPTQDRTQSAAIICPHCKKPLIIQIATAAEPDTTTTNK